MPEFLDLHGQSSKALRTLAEARMRRLGLHLGQDLVLRELWKRDGSTPGEVAAALHVTTPTIVKMATRMTAAGCPWRTRSLRSSLVPSAGTCSPPWPRSNERPPACSADRRIQPNDPGSEVSGAGSASIAGCCLR